MFVFIDYKKLCIILNDSRKIIFFLSFFLLHVNLPKKFPNPEQSYVKES